MPWPLTIPNDYPNLFSKNYWTGAVEFAPGTAISGASAVDTSSAFGVISFWIKFGAVTSTSSITHIIQPGSVTSIYPWDTAGILTMNAYILQDNDPHVTQYPIGLFLADFLTGNTLINAWVWVTGNPTPTGWHHCIWSWNAAQTNIVPSGSPVTGLPVLRTQFAFDRGGTGTVGAGTGIYDTLLGCQGNTIPTDNSPQPMPAVSGADSFNGNTGIVASTASSAEWQIGVDTSATMDFAYCYAGFSDGFFDLTYPGNLDQFVTGAITPVNLGHGGRNPTNQQTGNKLIPLFMHTGNANLLDILPESWSSLDLYNPSNPSSPIIVAWAGESYSCLQLNGSGTPNGVVVPGTNPAVWTPIPAPYGQPQFRYNGIDGTLWTLVQGAVTTAATQPDIGI